MKRIILVACILFSSAVYGQSGSSNQYPTINDLQRLFFTNPQTEGFRHNFKSELLYPGPNVQIRLIRTTSNTRTEPASESVITVVHHDHKSYKIMYETSSEQDYIRLQESVKAKYKPVKNKPQEELEFEKDVFRAKFSRDEGSAHPYTMTLLNQTRKSQVKN